MHSAPSSSVRSPRRGLRSWRGGRVFAALAVLLIPLAGCATKKDLRLLQEELQRLAERQEAAIRELEELTSATRDTIQGQSESLFSLRGETLRRLTQIQDDLVILQEMAGQNQRDLATIRRDLDSGTFSGGSPAGAAAAGAGAAAVLGGLQTDSAAIQTEAETMVPTMAGGAEAMYQAGVRQHSRGSLTAARAAFNEFVSAYPSDPNAPRAYLYLADILVQEEELEDAIEAFEAIPQDYPESDVVPDALYRAALLYIEQGDSDEARSLLERVVGNHPDSGAAILARQRLQEVG